MPSAEAKKFEGDWGSSVRREGGSRRASEVHGLLYETVPAEDLCAKVFHGPCSPGVGGCELLEGIETPP